MKKKTITALGLLGLCVVILCIIMLYFANQREHTAETADLMGMYNAELAVRIAWKNGTLKVPGEYWYDANAFRLIPADEPKPPAFGLGAARRGGGLASFEKPHGVSYAYDEGTDYRDKLLHVTVRNMQGDLDIAVEWVNAD